MNRAQRRREGRSYQSGRHLLTEMGDDFRAEDADGALPDKEPGRQRPSCHQWDENGCDDDDCGCPCHEPRPSWTPGPGWTNTNDDDLIPKGARVLNQIGEVETEWNEFPGTGFYPPGYWWKPKGEPS